MCGIVAILCRATSRPTPLDADLLATLDQAIAASDDAEVMAELVRRVDTELKGVPGLRALVGRPELVAELTSRLDRLDALSHDHEAQLDAGGDADATTLEQRARSVASLRDPLWAIRRDRLRTARAVEDLVGRHAHDATLAAAWAVQQALSALDRLEVRGRDSAGVHVLVWDHGLSEADPVLARHLATRAGDPLFVSGSVRLRGGALSLVYKAAAEIGELGDNTAVIRRALRHDELLWRAVANPAARVAVLAHTRWASVGIISEPNAHPVNSDAEHLQATEPDGPDLPYVVAALNGDVDNHADLKAAHGLCFPGPITTDAKVIPALVARQAEQMSMTEAFRRTVSSFEGSVAIAAASAAHPDRLYLAQYGSGQALYVGLCEDAFIVASEPYGVVEETSRYVRLDGDTPADPQRPSSRGQIAVLYADRAGELLGVERMAYDGTGLPWSDSDVITAEVTTRDIDRGDAPHYLLKEVTEAPDSLHKTLRGRIVRRGEHWMADLGEAALPSTIRTSLAQGALRRVVVIGQGTAAVAGRSTAAVLAELLHGQLAVEAVTATELSGFGLRLDMSDTLVIAVSQSGTTTDTNRTVDLARARGARVVAIVNRRGSDLTDKADGVVYTSDGRDVEMSVASTKAFYAQVAAGVLLACAIAEAAGVEGAPRRSQLLESLRSVPEVLRRVLTRRGDIAAAAARFAPPRRHWAVVGSGPNGVAAHEIRIKLSELCYKSIACDVIEDKKHIDLSSEPMILVCAAGLVGSNADDVAKEVAIYRAHKATPVVIATDGDERFGAASAVLSVPGVDPALAFLPCAMVGHLFGYEAARAIDASARPLREIRQEIERAAEHTDSADHALHQVRTVAAEPARRFLDALATGYYDGHLEASTAVRLVTRLTGLMERSAGRGDLDDLTDTAGPARLIDDLAAALTQAIDELTRPVDAIKHQAKTVTVGISRSDEGVLDRPLVQAVLVAGAGRDSLAYRTLKVLADLDGAVESVLGSIRYAIEGDPTGDLATIAVVDRTGLAREVPSRVDTDPRLRGTKRRVADDREVLVAIGRRDGRPVILVPEVKGGQTTGITLLHVRFRDRLSATQARSVLMGYDRRYDRLVDWVSETEGVFRDDRLAEVPILELLTLPISEVADHWRQ
jgi:glucosamine--fructose-6-phosphate aminotransferase (isomerizing)